MWWGVWGEGQWEEAVRDGPRGRSSKPSITSQGCGVMTTGQPHTHMGAIPHPPPHPPNV